MQKGVEPSSKRQASKLRHRSLLGSYAEWCAKWWLRFKGYRILGIRVRHALGEIDIIAYHKQMVIFVEVKARVREVVPELYVSQHQIQRIQRAAALYIAARPELQNYSWRFDLIYWQLGKWPKHYENFLYDTKE